MPRCPTCYRRLAHDATCPGDGGTAPAAQPVATPDRADRPDLPGYGLEKPLGAGGFAVVWAAQRDSDGLPVAIKLAREVNQLADQRLAREAQVLERVGPPHVPCYHDTGCLADGRRYVVMERLHGRTVAAALESMARPPDSAWIQAVTKGLLAALQAVHACGVVHRDIKPENVFLVAGNTTEIKLFDFGLVAIPGLGPRTDASLTRTGEILGTAEYMAPEQVRGTDADARSDIYGVGVLLYELYTLRPPFTGDRASIEHGHVALRPPRPGQFAPVPEAVEQAILSCLAKNPARRPPDVASLRRTLDHAWAQADRGPASTVHESKVSLLVEKQQPVVLLALDVDAAAHEVTMTIKQYGGFVARQRGSRYVCAFSGMMVDDPFEAALAGARDLSERFRARAALHLTRLAMRRRRRRGPPSVVGRAVDEPESWLPHEPWQGILLTAALADIQPPGTTQPDPAHQGFAALADDVAKPHVATTLVGREPVLEQASTSLRACLDTSSPGLFTLFGEPGLGKSRLAHELAILARARCPDATIITARAAKIDTRAFAKATSRMLAALSERGVAPNAAAPDTMELPPLILILDDAHCADHELLDRIEYATLDHHGVPLWVVVIAHPQFEAARPQWGSRAHRRHRVVLEPLATEATMAMAAELLLPAEYPPAAFLQRLAQWARGTPQLLSGLVAELKRRGVVHKREHGHGWDVRTAELEQLPAAPAGQWLAARMLGEMPPELAACVRVCAVLGPSFTAEELAFIQDAMERHGGAGTSVDIDIGIEQLVGHGILESSGAPLDARAGAGELAFCKAAFRDAVYKLLAPKDREQIHRHAARYWESRLAARTEDGTTLEHFARHAGACGRIEEAASAWLGLGDAARQAHRHVEADAYYTNVLRLDTADPRVRAQAYGNRGEVRYHLYRIQEAFADLRRAHELGEELGDAVAVVKILLGQAMVADAASDYEAAAQHTREAYQRLAGVDDKAARHMLETRCLMAMGRTYWRQAQNDHAIELLTTAAQRAGTTGDYETEVIANLMLGIALVCENQRDQAERVFDAALRRCIATRDRLHECAVYGNRMFLWRKQPRRAIGDLRRAVQLAREIGNPEPERVATHNLAELLYWSGEVDEALVLARRSRALQQRFWKQIPHDAVLLARIHVGRDEFAEAREPVEWLARECKLDQDASDPYVYLLYRMVRLILDERGASQHEPGTTWAALVAEARTALPNEEFIEVCWWAARSAIGAGNWQQARAVLDEARARLHDAPIWRPRVEALIPRLP